MKMTGRMFLATALAVTMGSSDVHGDDPPVVKAVLTTAPLFNYEGAPATPDADDPAIWFNRAKPKKSLIIGTAKDAGLLVYDMAGRLVQAIRPPNAPQVLPEDPASPAGVNLAPDNPCGDSLTGETFGRFNNVDIAYNVPFEHGSVSRADVAIVSDRGCDRVRFYMIDPTDSDGPLVDITAPDVPRVFPTRYDQPSLVQPSGDPKGWRDNPVDDQNTVYGLTVAQRGNLEVFVSQRERGLVRELRILHAPGGRLTYDLKRTFLFDTSFDLRDEHRLGYAWTPCREAVQEEPQSEGLVFDAANNTLYVAFETIGLYKLPLSNAMPANINVGLQQLLEPVTAFGRAYRATPDDEEFECQYDPEGDPAPGDLLAEGSDANAGRFLQSDLEGLSIILSVRGETLLLTSSQGDSSFHFYQIDRRRARHVGAFLVEGVADTDGVAYLPVPLGAQYPLGLLVVQNGEAPEPPDTRDINGFEFDGATQFKYVSVLDILLAR